MLREDLAAIINVNTITQSLIEDPRLCMHQLSTLVSNSFLSWVTQALEAGVGYELPYETQCRRVV